LAGLLLLPAKSSQLPNEQAHFFKAIRDTLID